MEATLRVGSFRRVSAGFFCQKFDEKYIKIHHVYYRSICFITLDIHFCREFGEVPEESCPLVKELKDLDRSCVVVFVWNGKLEADDTEEETLGLKMDS